MAAKTGTVMRAYYIVKRADGTVEPIKQAGFTVSHSNPIKKLKYILQERKRMKTHGSSTNE